MSEPLTIWQCATGECERRSFTPNACACRSVKGNVITYQSMEPVQYFADTDVRPLWEATAYDLAFGHHERQVREAFDAFPAPSEWLR